MPAEPATYRFGPFVLDRAQRVLLRDGATVALTPKGFDLLSVLAESGGRVMTKEALMTALWPDTAVEESNLTFQMSALRKALGGERVIATIPGRGYQFVGRIEPLAEGETREMIIEQEERTTVTVAESEAVSRRALVIAAAVAIAAVILAAVAALVLQLRSPSPVAPVATSIAVLPFKPIVAATRDEALELGMADTLIMRLSHVPDITVRPTSAIRRYSALDQDPIEAARELDVASVLDGTIQRSGTRMRVNVRLLRTSDGAPLWADQFDQDVHDLFDVQDRVADGVARALTPQLSGRAQQLLTKRTTSDLEAYDLYVKGSYLKETQPTRAQEFFDRAIARDPRFASAYAAIAETWMLRGRFRNTTPRVQYERARAAAMKAIELDPQLGEAHAALAAVHSDWDWHWDRAEAEYRRALELNPNWVPAHHGYANLLLVRRRFDEALLHSRRAMELDPTSIMSGVGYGVVLRASGKPEASIAHLQEILELRPRLVPAMLHIGLAQLRLGRTEEAVQTFEQTLRANADPQQLKPLYAYAMARAGQRENALRLIEELEKKGSEGGAAFNMAVAWVGLGDHDRAFAYLDRAYEQRLYLLRYVVYDTVYDPIRGDPRYADLMRRMGL